MTISNTRGFESDREQVLQDLYSNIDVVRDFIAATKHRLLSQTIAFSSVREDAQPDLIELLVAEHAASSMEALILAELNGGYRYAGQDVEVENDDGAQDDRDATPRYTEALSRRREARAAVLRRVRRGGSKTRANSCDSSDD